MESRLLQPYLFLRSQDYPAIYFFVEMWAGTIPRVAYVGKTMELNRRLQWSQHHLLKAGYKPNGWLHLPLYGVKDEELEAAENCFLLLYYPEANRRMPRWVWSDSLSWVQTLIKGLGPERHEALFRFLLEKEPESPEEGQPMRNLMLQELGRSLPKEKHLQIVHSYLLSQ